MICSAPLRARCSLSILLAVAALPAQDVAAPSGAPAPGNRIVCDLPASDVPFFRADDGRIPASWARADAPEEAGIPDGDLRTTALAVLATVADGSTLRSGPHKEFLKAAVSWLRHQQDDAGRFGLRTEPDWWLDHAIVTDAIGEAGRVSTYTLLRVPFERSVAVLTGHLRHFAGDVDPELLLWCRLITRVGRDYEQRIDASPKRGEAPPWDSGVAALDVEVRRLTNRAIPTDERARAARYLFERLEDTESDAEFVAALAPSFLADEGSFDDVDPLALFYGTAAQYRVGATLWKPIEDRLKDSIIASQSTETGVRGTWAPRGDFGARFGRNGMTAARLLVLCMYYRYSNLEYARD